MRMGVSTNLLARPSEWSCNRSQIPLALQVVAGYQPLVRIMPAKHVTLEVSIEVEVLSKTIVKRRKRLPVTVANSVRIVSELIQ